MREIKFRAWDSEQRVMRCNPDPQIIQAVIFGNDYEGRVKIMQFTGLKDCKGVEIYEGDIVKLNNDEIAIVEYWVNGGQWVIHTPDFDMEGGQGLYQAHINQMEHKVIGNLYENPKLLNEAKKS